MKFFIFLSLATAFHLAATSPSFADTAPNTSPGEARIQPPADYSKTMLLPVNEMKGLFAQLEVPIEFKLAHSDQTEPQPGMRQMIFEFIPEGERLENWTRIITAQSFVGKHMQAEPFVNISLSNIEQAVGKVNMGETNTLFASREGFEEATASVSYTHHGVKETLLIHVYCGPHDTAVMQMTYRPDRIPSGLEVTYETQFKDAVKLLSKDQLPEDLRKKLG